MKPAKTFKLSSAILGLALATGSANAALLAYYIDGTAADAAALANLTTTTGYSASDLSVVGMGTGTSITVTAIGSSPNTVQTPAGPTAGSTVGSEWLSMTNSFLTNDSTPDSNLDYVEFNVAGTGGNLIDPTSLTFDLAVAVSAHTAMIVYCQGYYSTDGINYTSIGSVGSVAQTNTTIGNYLVGPSTQSIDLTSLPNASTYYFRIGFGDNSGSGNKTGWAQGFQLNGTIVSVPEPRAALLGALGLMMLLRRRRA